MPNTIYLIQRKNAGRAVVSLVIQNVQNLDLYGIPSLQCDKKRKNIVSISPMYGVYS